MNATATSASTPTAEIPLTRKEKEKLLQQMYFRQDWIELIRLFGYQTLPMEKARQAIKPLAEKFGKEPMACGVRNPGRDFHAGQGTRRPAQATYSPHGVSDAWT